MARIEFAKAIARYAACPPGQVEGASVREALDRYFDRHPAARTYVLDERGAVRTHVTVFVDSELITDRTGLTDPIGDDAEIHVFQALSGGTT